MGDLAKLIAVVEAGTCPDFCPMWHSQGLCVEAENAFCGSLDAALRLHEALLPWWSIRTIGQTDGGSWFVHIVYGFPTSYSRSARAGYEDVMATPARAWLLAILRALQAQPTPPDEPGPADPRRRG